MLQALDVLMQNLKVKFMHNVKFAMRNLCKLTNKHYLDSICYLERECYKFNAVNIAVKSLAGQMTQSICTIYVIFSKVPTEIIF